MNTIKRITGLTAAAAMLLSAGALPANAYTFWKTFTYTAVENGAVAVHNDDEVISAFIAVTDGTELETFDTWSDALQPFRSVKEITESQDTFISTWTESEAALFESYGADARFYSIVFLNEPDSVEELSKIGRSYMLENEGVLDVIRYSSHLDALAEWDGRMDVYYSAAMPDEVLEEFHTFHEGMINTYQTQYSEWQQMLADWREETDLNEMSAAEMAASRAAAGIPSEYEMVDYAFGIAEQIKAAYPEYITFSQPSLTLLDGTVIYTGASVWNGVGDVNGDGEIDASDAAAILSEAALNGTGNSGTFTSKQAAAADVNADGRVDSSDAAIILVYSAQTGTDTGISLADAVKK